MEVVGEIRIDSFRDGGPPEMRARIPHCSVRRGGALQGLQAQVSHIWRGLQVVSAGPPR